MEFEPVDVLVFPLLLDIGRYLIFAYADSMEYMYVLITILQFIDLFRRCPSHISQSKNSLIQREVQTLTVLSSPATEACGSLIAPGLPAQHSHTSASIRKSIPDRTELGMRDSACSDTPYIAHFILPNIYTRSYSPGSNSLHIFTN